MGTVDNLRNKLDGTMGLDETDAFNKMTDFTVDFLKAAADGMASDVTAATKFWCNPFDFNISVISGKASPNAGLTASDAANAQINIQTDNAADSAPATAIQWSTATAPSGGTGNWLTDIAMNQTSRTSANCTLVPGANLFFAIAKTGGGVAVPISTYVVRLRRIGG